MAVLLCVYVALAPAAYAASQLASGASLDTGGVLISGNGHYTLANQNDGNLVLYRDGYAIWASETSRPGVLTMQTDGNLVLEDGQGPAWATATGGNSGATLSLQDDGNVVVYAISNDPIWSSGTANVYPDPLAGPPALHAAVAVGSTHALLLRADGTVWAWGMNGQGQLGDGTQFNRSAPVQVTVAGGAALTNVVAVAAADATSYALTSAGIVWSWGYYYNGALGDGTSSTRPYAAPVPGLTDVVAIVAGRAHVLALKANHSIWAWGENGRGQLGLGVSSLASWYPVEATAVGVVQTIASTLYGDDSYAIRADGSVLAWGDNQFGQLGNGSTSLYQVAPSIVSNISGMVGVAAGSSTAFAWNASGSAWAWGYNGSGRLGDGTAVQRTTPSPIASPLPVQIIDGGGSHTVGIATDGTPMSWGWNGVGQLGDGTMNSRTAPAGVPNLVSAVSIAGGANFSAALLADGSVWAWGDNYYTQLGDGSNWSSTVPVRVLAPGGILPTLTPTFSKLPGAYSTASVQIEDAHGGSRHSLDDQRCGSN